jgi:DNA helicase-2/ATP-dependent DNA helicase PcrA
MVGLSELLERLNPQQREATRHASGPLLVIAGAGTGKTNTLAARVAALIASGADPAQILLLTFTRRAAAEMLRRAGRVVGQGVADRVWGGTFHSVALRILRAHGRQLGLRESFTILDQGDAEDLLHLIRTDLGLHQSATRFPQKRTLLAIYSACVNSGIPLNPVMETRFPWCADHLESVKRVFREYASRKADRGLADYDDLLLYWDQALDTAGAGPAIADRFRHVLVDEYQDTNAIQGSILRKLWTLMSSRAGPAADAAVSPAAGCSVMVVGDDAQSIYSFRGATVENILQFPKQLAGTTVVTLEQNYRSVMPILAACNAVMARASKGFVKNLWSERPGGRKPLLVTCYDESEQSRYVAERVLECREEGIPLARQAVLFRAGHNSDLLEVELARRNVPFVKWGGLKFLEAAHVKDFLAFLRILENPADEIAWMRVLQLLEGIGPGRARQAVRHLQEHADNPQALLSWKAPGAARDTVAGLVAALTELGAAAPALPLPAQIERVRRFYVPILEGRYDRAEMRARDLDQLEVLARRAPDRAAFLADLTLDPPASTGDLAGPPLVDEEFLVLSTIHSAKGCEWDAVYVIHAADGVIPSDMAQGEADLEEERRLLYVALTRARDRLCVTFPLRYHHRKHALGDSHSYAQLTRFIPPELFGLFERAGSGFGEQVRGTPPGSPEPIADDVRLRLERLWE